MQEINKEFTQCTHQAAGPDCPVVARNSEVLGSNPT